MSGIQPKRALRRARVPSRDGGHVMGAQPTNRQDTLQEINDEYLKCVKNLLVKLRKNHYRQLAKEFCWPLREVRSRGARWPGADREPGSARFWGRVCLADEDCDIVKIVVEDVAVPRLSVLFSANCSGNDVSRP